MNNLAFDSESEDAQGSKEHDYVIIRTGELENVCIRKTLRGELVHIQVYRAET